jgi:hypothetical protein
VSLARLLAHYESEKSSAVTLVPVEFCQELAKGLRAEKITRRLYRLLPPDSVFSHAGDFPQLKSEPVEQLNLASRMELPGLKFIPSDPARRRAARRADAMATLAEYVWA